MAEAGACHSAKRPLLESPQCVASGRSIQHGLDGHTVTETGERNGPVGNSGGEVGGSVEGIDRPVAGTGGDAVATFLTQDTFAWMKMAQPLHKGLVAPTVAGGGQGTIGLELRDELAKILSLTIPLLDREACEGGPSDRSAWRDGLHPSS